MRLLRLQYNVDGNNSYRKGRAKYKKVRDKVVTSSVSTHPLRLFFGIKVDVGIKEEHYVVLYRYIVSVFETPSPPYNKTDNINDFTLTRNLDYYWFPENNKSY